MTFLWFLEGIRTPFLEQLMQFITYFGQELIVIAVICTFYWCTDKRFAYLLGFTYFTAGLGVQALKITFRIPRPWILDPQFKAVESAVAGATGYSFPSGHTQSATCLFFPLSLYTSRLWAKLLCILAFLLIGFSRMYLGCHTPKDVLVSMGLSLVVSSLIWKFQEVLLNSDRYLKLIAAILICLSLATAAYSLLLHGNGTIETKYALDCCKAAGAGLGFSIGWYVERTKLNFDTHTGRIGTQILKLLIGLTAALFIKEGFSLIFGSSILAKMSEYFILVLWVLVIYPCLFQRVTK
ncbi:MAG: phosphatase PAP2 family protein [Dorea sp.]|jgi:membrane-associated phospholipid phosphatase|nr:phosphatase PAP2 family protein [Dorea sp.]